MKAAVFAAVFAAYFAGHQLADYWAQTNSQALGKDRPGWKGRLLCAGHVGTYTLILAAFLALAAGVLGIPVDPWTAAAGLAVSALTHFFADRRAPLGRLAALIGKEGLWGLGEGPSSGAALMDQSWHIAWLFVAALVTAA